MYLLTYRVEGELFRQQIIHNRHDLLASLKSLYQKTGVKEETSSELRAMGLLLKVDNGKPQRLEIGDRSVVIQLERGNDNA